MKQVTLTIDHDEMDGLLREHLVAMFPALVVESIYGLSYSDVTVRLVRPGNPVEPIDEPEPLPSPQPVPDEEILF